MRFPQTSLLLSLTLALAPPAIAAEQAGVSAAVRGQVALTRVQVAVGRQVVGGEPILLQDAIQSGQRSGMQIMLLDQTVFTIGPESELVIDEFVYDPKTNAGKLSAEITDNAAWREGRPAQVTAAEGELVATVERILAAQAEDRRRGG